MGFQIEDGTGTGGRARVNAENQLLTQAESHELQHHISINDGQVYQAWGTYTLATSGQASLLHIKNDDPERLLVVSYMRVQFPGGDGTIDGNTYFACGFNTAYTTGGTEITPINMNDTSGNQANVTAYTNNPTTTGELDWFDIWYPDQQMQTFNKHGSLILGLNDTIEWRLYTDQTGLAYARITLMMLSRASV